MMVMMRGRRVQPGRDFKCNPPNRFAFFPHGRTDSLLAIDPDWVADQARCILEDMPVAAFKMGMLGSTEIVTVVAEVVSDYPDIPLVLDPVFASGRGDEFANADMISA